MSDPKSPGAAKADAPPRPADTDSAGTYFVSIEEFEGRKIKRKDGVRVAEPETEDPTTSQP